MIPKPQARSCAEEVGYRSLVDFVVPLSEKSCCLHFRKLCDYNRKMLWNIQSRRTLEEYLVQLSLCGEKNGDLKADEDLVRLFPPRKLESKTELQSVDFLLPGLLIFHFLTHCHSEAGKKNCEVLRDSYINNQSLM